MIDIQNERENRGIPLNCVGVSDYRMPIHINNQPTIANIKLGVSLDEYHKGIHMSRLCILLNDLDEVNNDSIKQLLSRAIQVSQSQFSKIEIETSFYLTKKAPVSQLTSKLFYGVKIVAQAECEKNDIVHKLTIPITSLCPCSKAISIYGAHNQRGSVSIEMFDIDTSFYPKIIHLIEKVAASSELFEVLKRPDEKFVTEFAYNNPKFVEDIVRDAIGTLQTTFFGKLLSVEVENYESIHAHNAFAYTEIKSPIKN